MGVFYFNCPRCGQRFECEERYVGEKAICPVCQLGITIQAPPPPLKRRAKPHAVEDAPPPAPKKPRIVEKPSDPPVSPAAADSADRCPYCDEKVSPAASVCPHCRGDIFRCPQCGNRGTMDFSLNEPTAAETAKSLGGGVAGAVAGGLIFGPIGAAIGGIVGMAGKTKPSGCLKCRICGYILK